MFHLLLLLRGSYMTQMRSMDHIAFESSRCDSTILPVIAHADQKHSSMIESTLSRAERKDLG